MQISHTHLEIEYTRPDNVRPSPRNARHHPQRQIDQIKVSIGKVGFTNPILVDENLEIIAGHGRWMAAKEAALVEIPIIKLVGLSDVQKRTVRIADNKIAQNSMWDMELLREELSALAELKVDLDFDLADTGFGNAEIDGLLYTARAFGDDDDNLSQTPERAVTHLGDVWIVGDHRVGCGDVRDRVFMARALDGKLADTAFLDPPYNVSIQGHAGGRGKIVHREFAMASGEMSEAQYTQYLKEALGGCAAVSRNGAVHFVAIDNGHIGELVTAGAAVYGKRLNIAVWNKSNGGMGALYRSKYENIAVFRVGDAAHLNAVELGKHGRNRTNVWDYPSVNTFGARQQDLALHPTVKPVRLVADAIMDVTQNGDLVLDAFLGSGTTLVAAHRVGRRCVGVEIDPLYVDVALLRFARLTGIGAVLESGETWEQVRARRLGEDA